jgi:hypothetical protein
VIFLAESMLYPLQTLYEEKPSPALQLDIVLRVLIALASRPGWLVLFLPMHDKGEIRLHQ